MRPLPVPVGVALLALLALVACSPAAPAAPANISKPVDKVCVDGTRFVQGYSGIAARYDPRYESDRQQLGATHSLATARSLLQDLSRLLDQYSGELAQLQPPADFSDVLAAVVNADRDLSAAALELAQSPFGQTDQAAFQVKADARNSAVHDLRLQLAFVSSECQ